MEVSCWTSKWTCYSLLFRWLINYRRSYGRTAVPSVLVICVRLENTLPFAGINPMWIAKKGNVVLKRQYTHTDTHTDKYLFYIYIAFSDVSHASGLNLFLCFRKWPWKSISNETQRIASFCSQAQIHTEWTWLENKTRLWKKEKEESYLNNYRLRASHLIVMAWEICLWRKLWIPILERMQRTM